MIHTEKQYDGYNCIQSDLKFMWYYDLILIYHDINFAHTMDYLRYTARYIDGLVQDYSNSIANALELLQSCTKPSICTWFAFHCPYVLPNITQILPSYLLGTGADIYGQIQCRNPLETDDLAQSKHSKVVCTLYETYCTKNVFPCIITFWALIQYKDTILPV